LVEGEDAANLKALVLTSAGEVMAENVDILEQGATLEGVAATGEAVAGIRAAATVDMIMYKVESQAAGQDTVDYKAGVIVSDKSRNVNVLWIEAA
jgi:hypothetical protein